MNTTISQQGIKINFRPVNNHRYQLDEGPMNDTIGKTYDGKEVEILTDESNVQPKIRNEIKQTGNTNNSHEFQSQTPHKIDLTHRQIIKISDNAMYSQCKKFQEASLGRELSLKEKSYYNLFSCCNSKPCWIIFIVLQTIIVLAFVIALRVANKIGDDAVLGLTLGLTLPSILIICIAFQCALQGAWKKSLAKDTSPDGIFLKHRIAIYQMFVWRNNHKVSSSDDIDDPVIFHNIAYNSPAPGIDTHTHTTFSIDVYACVSNWFQSYREKTNINELNSADSKLFNEMLNKYREAILLLIHHNGCWENNEATLAEHYLKPVLTSPNQKLRQLGEEWAREFVKIGHRGTASWLWCS